MKNLKIAAIILVCSAIGFLIGAKYGGKVEKEIQIVEVEKTQIQENVRTIINERPDGSKTTIIEQEKNTKTVVNTDLRSKETRNENTWSLYVLGGSRLGLNEDVNYLIGFDRNIILGLSAGLYGRTDGEFGLSLRYSF